MFNLKELLKKTDFTNEEIIFLLGLKDPEQCKLLQEEAYRRTTFITEASLNVPTSALRIAVTAELGRTIIKYAAMR